MATITSDLALKNLKTFNTVAAEARTMIAHALEIDESRQSNNRYVSQNLITKYKIALKKLNIALSIKLSNCPLYSKFEIENTKEQLQKYLILVSERIASLEQSNEKIASTTTSSCSRSLAYSSRVVTKELLLRNLNKAMGEEIYMTIVSHTGIKLSQVEGNEEAKRALEESVIFPALNPSLFTGLRAPCKGILLYGPPGNGKTMIAKAVAEEANCTFFNISASTIMSKWVGEGEKMVKTLFQMARNAQPSIIFIDEVDSMLCERSENENGAQRRVKTEFLLQLDGCTTSSEDRILVLAATNRPQELDDGILRRFPQRIFIDLPDKDTRAKIILTNFESHKTKVSISKKELETIASETENYSFSDLFALCRAAAMLPVQSLGRDKLKNISEKHLRPVNYADLITALKSVRPSTSVEKRLKLQEFAGLCEDKT